MYASVGILCTHMEVFIPCCNLVQYKIVTTSRIDYNAGMNIYTVL